MQKVSTLESWSQRIKYKGVKNFGTLTALEQTMYCEIATYVKGRGGGLEGEIQKLKEGPTQLSKYFRYRNKKNAIEYEKNSDVKSSKNEQHIKNKMKIFNFKQN